MNAGNFIFFLQKGQIMAGFGDILKLMSHAKEIQAEAEKLKNELPKQEFSATGANGGITVVVGGDLMVKKITIAPELDCDRAFVEEELQAALNSAICAARMTMQERMQAISKQLGIELPSF